MSAVGAGGLRRAGERQQLLDDIPIDRALGGDVLLQLFETLPGVGFGHVDALQQLLDVVGAGGIAAQDVAYAREIKRPADSRWRSVFAVIRVMLAGAESGMRVIDARIEYGPGDLRGVDAEQGPRRVSLDSGYRSIDRGCDAAIERHLKNQRLGRRAAVVGGDLRVQTH
jgi:hypothetical protein